MHRDLNLDYSKLTDIRFRYQQGQNISEYLRLESHERSNSPDIIEAIYDLQAGTYIEWLRQNTDFADTYGAQLAEVLGRYVGANDTLLDVGTGELTTLAMTMKHLETKPSNLLAFDLSFSRLASGRIFYQELSQSDGLEPRLFVSDIASIPLGDKSVDVTTSNHALEPNGGYVSEILGEIFRVTRKAAVLFEPSFESNSDEGRDRMRRLGYISDLLSHARRLGGDILESFPLEHISNPLNPTYCYVLVPPQSAPSSIENILDLGQTPYTLPGTQFPLTSVQDALVSSSTGLAFPIVQGLPVLRAKNAFLASHLANVPQRKHHEN